MLNGKIWPGFRYSGDSQFTEQPKIVFCLLATGQDAPGFSTVDMEYPLRYILGCLLSREPRLQKDNARVASATGARHRSSPVMGRGRIQNGGNKKGYQQSDCDRAFAQAFIWHFTW